MDSATRESAIGYADVNEFTRRMNTAVRRAAWLAQRELEDIVREWDVPIGYEVTVRVTTPHMVFSHAVRFDPTEGETDA